MAVTSPLNRTDTYGTGAVSVFQFPYYFLQNADLQVWLTDYTTVAAGVPTLLVYGTDYTVAGAGNVLGGSITLLGAPTSLVLPVPPTSTQEISIIRSPALTQELILPGSGPLNTASIVTEFDNLEMQIQALAAKYGDNPFPSTSLATQIAALQLAQTGVTATFMGYIAGTTLTVTTMLTGALVPGQTLAATSLVANTNIQTLGTSTGGVGTVVVNNAQTLGSLGAPVAFTASGTGFVTSAGALNALASTAVGQGDALIGVLQPFAGAVATTQDKVNARTVSVMDFGATGKGTSQTLAATTSFAGLNTTGWTLGQWQAVYPLATALTNELDWCAIVTAIAFLQANGGGTLVFPFRHYVSQTIYLTGSITGGTSSYPVPSLPIITFAGGGAGEGGIVSGLASGVVLQLSKPGANLNWKLRLKDFLIDCQQNNVTCINGQSADGANGTGNNHYVDFDGLKIVGVSGAAADGIWFGTITDSMVSRTIVQAGVSGGRYGFRVSKADVRFTDSYAVYFNRNFAIGDLIEAAFIIHGGGSLVAGISDLYYDTANYYSSSSIVEGAFLGEHTATGKIVDRVATAGLDIGSLTLKGCQFDSQRNNSSFMGYITAGVVTVVSGLVGAIAANQYLFGNGINVNGWATPPALPPQIASGSGSSWTLANSTSLNLGSAGSPVQLWTGAAANDLMTFDFGGRVTIEGCNCYNYNKLGNVMVNFGQFISAIFTNNTNMCIDPGSVGYTYDQLNKTWSKVAFNFYKTALTSGAGSGLLAINASALTAMKMPFPGNVVGLGCTASVAISGGSPQATVSKNGSDYVGTTLTMAGASSFITFARGVYPFAAGDTLGVHAYPNTFSSGATDIDVVLFVEM